MEKEEKTAVFISSLLAFYFLNSKEPCFSEAQRPVSLQHTQRYLRVFYETQL